MQAQYKTVYMVWRLLLQGLFILGLGLIVATLNVFYRDVDPGIKLVTQLWFYASPVIYPSTLVPERWLWLYYANPMAGVIDALRDVLLNGRAPGPSLAAAAGIAVVLLLASYGFFKRVEGRLADVI